MTALTNKLDSLVTMAQDAREIAQRIGDHRRALYLRSDGSIQIGDVRVEPNQDGGFRPIRRFRQEVIRNGGFYSPAVYREEFRFVTETERYYIYEEIS